MSGTATTRLTPFKPEQSKGSVKGTLDKLAARGPMVLRMADSEHISRGPHRAVRLPAERGVASVRHLPKRARGRCTSAGP